MYFLILDETLWTETSGGHTYDTTWISVLEDSTFRFYVRTCEEARIALSTITGQTHTMTHEIILGMHLSIK